MVTWSWPGAVKGSVFFFSCCSGSFCCLWDFLVAASGDYSLTSVLGLLGFSLPWLLLLGRVDLRAHRLSSCGTQAWLPRGMWDLGSQTRGRIHIPCIGRWTLNCWAPGELWDISLRGIPCYLFGYKSDFGAPCMYPTHLEGRRRGLRPGDLSV